MATLWDFSNPNVTFDNPQYLFDGSGPVSSSSPILPNGGPGLYGSRVTYQSMTQGSSVVLATDFISKLQQGETISSATTTASVYTGVDPNASSLVQGAPSVSGTVVNTLVGGGVTGVIYEIKVVATTSLPQTIPLCGYLAVVPDLP